MHAFTIAVKSPGEIKRREVVLDPQESPGETKSREVELGSESWTCNSSVEDSVTLPRTAAETATAEYTSCLAVARYPTALT